MVAGSVGSVVTGADGSVVAGAMGSMVAGAVGSVTVVVGSVVVVSDAVAAMAAPTPPPATTVAMTTALPVVPRHQGMLEFLPCCSSQKQRKRWLGRQVGAYLRATLLEGWKNLTSKR